MQNQADDEGKLLNPTQNNPRLLKWAAFISGLGFYTPVAPLYFITHGVSISSVVLSQAAYSIAIIATEVPTGLFGDKFGHRKSVIFGYLLEVLGLGLLLISPNELGLIGGYILLGVGASFQSGSMEALLYEGNGVSEKSGSYRRHLAQILSNDTLAFALGTAIVGITYGAFGDSVLALLIAASLITKVAGLLISTRLHDVVTKAIDGVQGSSMWRTFKRSMSHIRKDSTLLNLTYVKVLTLTAQFVVLSIYQPYFTENNVSPYFIGFVLTIGGLANAVAMRQIYRLERLMSLDKAVLVLGGLMGISYAVFSVVSQPWALVAMFVFLQAQYNLLDPIISDYINDRSETGIRATILSGVSLIRSVGNAVSKIILGLAVAGVGIGGMLKIQAVYLLIGSLLSFWLLKRCGCIYVLGSDKD